MPRNIEIKARIDSVDALLPRALTLVDTDAGAGAERLLQDDSFFAVTHGRLKLRQFGDGSAELIQYQRADTEAAKASEDVRVPTSEPAALREALTRSCGLLGRVQKERRLLRAGQTRIHLDRVQDLGDFIELEVVLQDGQSDAQGAAIADALMESLGLADAPRIAGAYLDLLAEKALQAAQTANQP